MRKVRVLALVQENLVPPDSIDALPPEQVAPMRTEYDVVSTLRSCGHPVRVLGVGGDLGAIRTAIEEWRPQIAFNLLEEFAGEAVYDQHVVSYLELMHLPYTGCGPRGLMLARDKALCKKVLSFHRIAVPEFAVFRVSRAVRRPSRLQYPLFVKSLNEEASLGISRASLVDDDDKLRERVAFIHERLGTDAIAERYIEGRELYVGVLGNRRPEVLPIWELLFTGMPEGMPHIATARVKWDARYQERWGIRSERARDLPPGMEDKIRRTARRIYRCLGLTGYARIDMRLSPEGRLYVLEANPNPQLARGEDFAESAEAAGTPYDKLLQRILRLGLSRARQPAALTV